MFTVIYSFNVKPEQTIKFEKAWKDLTTLIHKHEASLGSRLHTQSQNSYIAYAQWSDRETWKNSGNNMPSEAVQIRKNMKDSCNSIETLFELDVVADLLVGQTN